MSQEIASQYLAKQIQSASPAQQVVMLYDGAIRFYLQAQKAIKDGDIEARFNYNQRAGNIISHLLDTLDHEKGGEVAARLARIYQFILVRQMDIDLKNDPTAVDEIIGHLRQLRSSWEAIAKGNTSSANTNQPEEPAEYTGPRSATA